MQTSFRCVNENSNWRASSQYVSNEPSQSLNSEWDIIFRPYSGVRTHTSHSSALVPPMTKSTKSTSTRSAKTAATSTTATAATATKSTTIPKKKAVSRKKMQTREQYIEMGHQLIHNQMEHVSYDGVAIGSMAIQNAIALWTRYSDLAEHNGVCIDIKTSGDVRPFAILFVYLGLLESGRGLLWDYFWAGISTVPGLEEIKDKQIKDAWAIIQEILFKKEIFIRYHLKTLSENLAQYLIRTFIKCPERHSDCNDLDWQTIQDTWKNRMKTIQQAATTWFQYFEEHGYFYEPLLGKKKDSGPTYLSGVLIQHNSDPRMTDQEEKKESKKQQLPEPVASQRKRSKNLKFFILPFAERCLMALDILNSKILGCEMDGELEKMCAWCDVRSYRFDAEYRRIKEHYKPLYEHQEESLKIKQENSKSRSDVDVVFKSPKSKSKKTSTTTTTTAAATGTGIKTTATEVVKSNKKRKTPSHSDKKIKDKEKESDEWNEVSPEICKKIKRLIRGGTLSKSDV